MKREEAFCPLSKSKACLEKACPLWHQSSSMFEGCILDIIIWSSVTTTEFLDNNKQQNIRKIYRHSQPCPSIELEGEMFDVLIEDYARIMEITGRLRRCKTKAELKEYAVEEAYKNPPGIQILN